MANIENEGGKIKTKWVSGIVSKQEKGGIRGGGRKEGRKRRQEGSVKPEAKEKSWNSVLSHLHPLVKLEVCVKAKSPLSAFNNT